MHLHYHEIALRIRDIRWTRFKENFNPLEDVVLVVSPVWSRRTVAQSIDCGNCGCGLHTLASTQRLVRLTQSPPSQFRSQPGPAFECPHIDDARTQGIGHVLRPATETVLGRVHLNGRLRFQEVQTQFQSLITS